jgi:hypothetical protein
VIQLSRLFHQRCGAIEAEHVASAKRQPARDRPRAGAEIERAHPRSQDSHRIQPIEEFVGKACAMPSVVARGLAEISPQLLESNFRRSHRTILS